MTKQTAIIGGGLTGILCALRLSKLHEQQNHQIILIDSNQTLGGRFFFPTSGQKEKSGFGFEFEDQNDLDTLKRHIFLYLTESETTYLEQWVHSKLEEHPFLNTEPKKYFVKKDLLDSEYILLSNSEFLTKKDAEFLKSIINLTIESINEEKEVCFSDFSIWKNAHKSLRENVYSIIENVAGNRFLDLPVSVVLQKLHYVFSEKQKRLDPFFSRNVEIEKAFFEILTQRGVKIYTECTLKSFEEKNNQYSLCLVHKSFSEMSCDNLIFTIPPYNLRMLINKENLSGELSRFINKVQPTSLICLELHDFKSKTVDQMQSYFLAYNHFYFPVEGAQGYVTGDGRFIASIELDYETSLQAPSVREALTKLRRSVRRILKPEFADELKKGTFIRKMESFEKIILVPIFSNIPSYTQLSNLSALNDVSCKFKNVTISGDYLHSLGDAKWKRIVKSIDACLAQA